MTQQITTPTVQNINSVLRQNAFRTMYFSTPKVENALVGTFSVTHDLGEEPDLMQYMAIDAVTVRATKDNMRTWKNGRTAQLTGSAAGQVLVWFGKYRKPVGAG